MSDQNSVEASIAAKLKLAEITKPEQIVAVLEYVNSIISGTIRSSPVELQGLLKLLLERQTEDAQGRIKSYFKNHEMLFKVFFRENSQRFDRFEFKEALLQLKGETAEDHFVIPYEARRNFEQMKPMNVKPYIEMLEANPLELELRKKKTTQISVQQLEEKKQLQLEEFEKQIQLLRSDIAAALKRGLSSERIRDSIRQAVEQSVPALQMKYNTEAVSALELLLLSGTGDSGEIFQSLSMSGSLRDRFCTLVHKNVTKQ